MTRSGPTALALPATVVMATIWIAVACAIGGTTGTAPAPSVPASVASALPAPVSAPPANTAAAVPTPVVPSASQDSSAPPAGMLAAGGSAIAGATGSYCWPAAGAVSCADLPPFTDSGPDLPVLTLGASDTQLHFSLADGHAFAGWSASYVDDDGNVVSLGSEGASFDPDAAHPSVTALTTADFSVPPAHDESIVQVFVQFAEGGDSSYGWNVTVP